MLVKFEFAGKVLASDRFSTWFTPLFRIPSCNSGEVIMLSNHSGTRLSGLNLAPSNTWPICSIHDFFLTTHQEQSSIGCTPLNAVPILFCVKGYSKHRHFRVFIMIKIGQTHVFLKDYVYTHQIGSHFVSGYRLDFSPTGPESKTFILQSF